MNTTARPLLKCQSTFTHISPKLHALVKLKVLYWCTYVTVKEPCAWIIGSPADDNFSAGRDSDCISPSWVLLTFDKWWVQSGIIRSDIKALSNNLEFVSITLSDSPILIVTGS